MTKDSPVKASWNEQHQAALLRSIVQLVLTNRSSLYATPELHDVSHNGGDVINRKIKQILTAMAGKDALAQALLNAGRGGGSPKKDKAGANHSANSSPTKKRKTEKVKAELEDELYSE